MHQAQFAAALLLSTLCAYAGPARTAGAEVEGTMTNAKLRQDTMVGVTQTLTALGCTRIDFVQPYVTAMPEGVPGARIWHERWLITCGPAKHPVDIRFNEHGGEAADYTITAAR